LEKINNERREALAKLLRGAVYAAPLVATFSMVDAQKAHAVAVNTSNVPTLTDWALPGAGLLLGATALVAMRKSSKT
jgi:hypothetical protein